MATPNTPAQRLQVLVTSHGGPSRDLLMELAMQIGKDTVAYIEVMYPEAIKAASSTFKQSVRNTIYNKIVSLLDLHTEAQIRERIDIDEEFRKEWLSMWRKLRHEPCECSFENRTPSAREEATFVCDVCHRRIVI